MNERPVTITHTTIAIDALVCDPAIWPRLARSPERIAQLANLLEEGIQLPPVKVERQSRRVLGGWHTLAAYESRHETVVPIEWIDFPEDSPSGTALLFAYHVDVDAALPYT